ncbi:ADP-ribosyltransferase [Lentilactobacillus otakiensis]|uniref:ADP-ribosyltransferase n=1 Tax=Lentilactobacillus otakiensis TaxID=481720 RepID=UPI003D171B23
MLKLRLPILVVTALIGLTVQMPASANSVKTEVDGHTTTRVSTSYHVKLKNIGRHYLVTRKPAKLYKLSAGKPVSHRTLTIPKNAVLAIQNHARSGQGVVVSLQGKKQKYLLNNPKSVVYNTTGVKNNSQTAKRLSSASKKWSSSLKKSQIKAIRYYTNEGYTKINTALRTPQHHAAKKVSDSITKINAGIRTFTLPSPITIYRGTSAIGVKKSLSNHAVKIGRSYQDAAYSSSTLSQMIALGFSSQHIVLKINLPAGNHGAYIDPISTNVGEKEYLMAGGTKLIVTGYQKAQSTVHTAVTVKKRGHAAQHHTNNVVTNYTLVTLNLKQ